MYVTRFDYNPPLWSFYVRISLLLTSSPFSMSLVRVIYRRVGEGVFAEHGYLSGDYTAEVYVPLLVTINYV